MRGQLKIELRSILVGLILGVSLGFYSQAHLTPTSLPETEVVTEPTYAAVDYKDWRSEIMHEHYDGYLQEWVKTIPIPEPEPNPYEPFIVECSAYCYNGRCTASGKPTIEGVTIAGKREWLGRTAVLYEINDDGGIGEFIGYREFTDTGYGKDSTLYPGYGTIQTGECVDLYFDGRQTALEWGRRKIYIQVINGCG